MSLTNSVDSGLMAKKQLTPEEQSHAAVDLKVAKQPEVEGLGVGETIKQMQSLARGAAQGKMDKIKTPAKGSSVNKMNQSSAELLKQSWLNIIDSFGLTLIYINLHVFGRSILGEKVFCELGEEWIPKNMRSSLNSPAIKAKIKKISVVEKMLLILLDAIVFICLMIILVLLAVVVKIISNNAIENFQLIFSILTGG